MSGDLTGLCLYMPPDSHMQVRAVALQYSNTAPAWTQVQVLLGTCMIIPFSGDFMEIYGDFMALFKWSTPITGRRNDRWIISATKLHMFEEKNVMCYRLLCIHV